MTAQILRQRYKIIKQLAQGGFGETFLAEDLDLPVTPKPKCVVKRIQPQMINPDVVRLFEKEGEILYKLGQNHGQIPKLFAYFQQNGQFYLIQEFIDGHDLSQEILAGKKWNESEVIKFLQEVLELLAYIHQNSVIHRDVKPANIMRRRDGKLVLIDFGIVKEVGATRVHPSGYTSRTLAVGTPGYMPSEQALGKPKPSSDLYALGMTAIQALTGMMPELLIEESNCEVVWQNYATVSDRLAEILNKMVRYDFRQRYSDANEVLQALNQLIIIPKLNIVPLKPIKIDEQYGFIDISGLLVIQPKFDQAWHFCEGLARVRVKDRWGYIDQEGQMVIPPQFEDTGNFIAGLARVRFGERWGFIDQKGRMVIQPQFDWVDDIYEGLARVRIGEKWGYIDKTGRFAIQPQFDWAGYFSEGLAVVPRIGNKWGYIDKTGRLVIQPQFDRAGSFAEGLAGVEVGDKWGYIDKNGDWIIKPQFEGAGEFADGLAIVSVRGKYGFIDQ
ncbi:MAG TPA: WG repeat-containing protein, partial [Nostocaceae cyanobacterium]|nr:WG repeat-containing protein [Nostocaceae cyanobacterium]